MLIRLFSNRLIGQNHLAQSESVVSGLRSLEVVSSSCWLKSKAAPVPKKEHGHYIKTPHFVSTGGPMMSKQSLLCGSHRQVRFSYTDNLPNLHKYADNLDRYKKDKSVPYSVQKNIVGYTMLMMTGGVALFMGRHGLSALATYFGPDKSKLATAILTVDLSKIPEGEFQKFKFRGKSVIIRHRTQTDIDEMKKVPLKALPHPEEDSKRFLKPTWLVVEAVCPHLGCIPIVGEGDYHGFFCPCHGSHFDKSGRIRKGPSPTNLAVPDHSFIDENTLLLGA